jgi:hypothetical protein
MMYVYILITFKNKATVSVVFKGAQIFKISQNLPFQITDTSSQPVGNQVPSLFLCGAKAHCSKRSRIHVSASIFQEM